MVQAAAGGPTVPGYPSFAWTRDWLTGGVTKWGYDNTTYYSDWTFSPPANTGGSAILEYEVASVFLNFTTLASSPVYTVPGWQTGANAKVRCRNTIGWSEWSPLVTGTRFALYPAGWTGTATTSTGTGTKTWTPVINTYGLPLIRIDVYRDTVLWQSFTGGSFTLPTPIAYTYTARLITEAGTGSPASVTSPIATSIPTVVSAVGTWRDIGSDYKSTWDEWLTTVTLDFPVNTYAGANLYAYIDGVKTGYMTSHISGTWAMSVFTGNGWLASPVGKTLTVKYDDIPELGGGVNAQTMSNGVTIS
jgi:hypothetical protein